jgi:hypothetical protein
MTSVKYPLLLAACGSALLAQQQNVIFSGGAGPGMAGAVGPNTFAFVSGELVGGNPVKGAPYSGNAVTENTQTLADGNHIVNRSTANVYRDGEGRERREQSLPNIGGFAPQGAPSTMVFISDPVAGANYSLNPDNKTAIKLPTPPLGTMPPSGARADTHVMVQRVGMAGASVGGPNVMFYSKTDGGTAPAPPAVEQLGTKVVEGVQAEGTRTTITIPAGQIGNDKPIQIVDEVWRSPDLQVIVHSEHSDPRMGSTAYSLQNISRSDPSPTLFQLPPDYTVKDAPTFQKALPALP